MSPSLGELRSRDLGILWTSAPPHKRFQGGPRRVTYSRLTHPCSEPDSYICNPVHSQGGPLGWALFQTRKLAQEVSNSQATRLGLGWVTPKAMLLPHFLLAELNTVRGSPVP